MAEIVNLRRVRKQHARDSAAREAEANRARHGRTPAQKEREAQEAARREALLDGARRDDAE